MFPVLLMNEEVTVSRRVLHWGISRLTHRACKSTECVCTGRRQVQLALLDQLLSMLRRPMGKRRDSSERSILIQHETEDFESS